MAGAVIDRAWRRSSADEIEADLAALWRDLAREGPISRAVMSNLVVFCRCAADADVDLATQPDGVPVDRVVRHHPARVILLRHDPDACDPNAPLAAQVGVLLFGPREAQYGVEQIVIKSACAEEALPSIVRRYALGDLPTSTWWTEDLSDTPPLTSLVTMGRQLVYDSRQWHDVDRAVLALAPLLAPQFGPDLADINWRRAMPLRQALLRTMQSTGEQGARNIFTTVHIRHRRGEAALAWLLAGWLHRAASDHLSDSGVSDSTAPPLVEEDPRLTADVLTASFAGGLNLQLGDAQLAVYGLTRTAPFVAPVAREDPAEAVAAELHTLTQDFGLHAALTALIQRFSGT